jgi:hypothetical protein
MEKVCSEEFGCAALLKIGPCVLIRILISALTRAEKAVGLYLFELKLYCRKMNN